MFHFLSAFSLVPVQAIWKETYTRVDNTDVMDGTTKTGFSFNLNLSPISIRPRLYRSSSNSKIS